MKNNKKLLVFAFVSVVGVVSFGRQEISHTQTDTNTQVISTDEFYAGIKDGETTTTEKIEIDDNVIETVLSGQKYEAVQDNDIIQESEQEKQEHKTQFDYKDGWTTTPVNVRTAPSTDSEILTVYQFNTNISYSKYNDEWSIIKYKDTHAYIYSNYISDTEAKKNSYTDDELYMLSHLIMGEAGGESDTCQLYVGSVVLNRIKHEHFPDTMKEVIFQKGQYACTWDGNYNKEPTERCIENAQKLLEYGSVLPDNVVWQAGFKQGKGTYVILDGVYFCY